MSVIIVCDSPQGQTLTDTQTTKELRNNFKIDADEKKQQCQLLHQLHIRVN